MATYRCYLLGVDGKIIRSEVVECPTDAAALEEAERRLAICGYPTIEVWEKERRIGMVGHPIGHVEVTAQKTGEGAQNPAQGSGKQK